MARKARTRRRRRSNFSKARRSYRGVRRSVGRSGFLNHSVLMSGVGVAGGLIAAPIITSYVPPTILASNRYAVPLVKVGLGLAAHKVLKKYNGPLSAAFALGLIGSGVLDVYQMVRANSGAPGAAGYELGDIYGEGGGDNFMLEDGSTIQGYALPSGEIVNDDGDVLGEIDMDEVDAE